MGKSKKKSGEYSSDSAGSSDSEDEIKSKKHKKSSKKSKKHKSKKKKQRRSSSSGSSESDNWVEHNFEKKQSPPPLSEDKTQREDWMTADNFFLPVFTKEKPQSKSAAEKATHQAYDPATSSRELNPYFRTGEGGMPTFQRPKDRDDDDFSYGSRSEKPSSGNWRKNRRDDNRQQEHRQRSRSRSRSMSPRRRLKSPIHDRRSTSPDEDTRSPEEKHRVMLPAKPPPEVTDVTASHSDFLTDEQMNEIGAKMIKAELKGNEALVAKLKDKLDRAKAFKSSGKAPPQRAKEQVVLSITNAAGVSRPVTKTEETKKQRPHDKKRNKRVETHEGGERTKYYPDDGKYDIKQMVSLHNPPLIAFKNFFNFSLNVRSMSMEKTKTSSSRKPSAKLKTRNKWTWLTFSLTLFERTKTRKLTSVTRQFESTNEWRKFSIPATSASTRRKWIRIW